MSKETARTKPTEVKTDADTVSPTSTPDTKPLLMADHDQFGPLNERDDDGRDQKYGFRISLSPPSEKPAVHERGGDLIILSGTDDSK